MTDTQHYQLNQWAADDQVLRTDFNADNAKIDAALGAVKGCNCQLYFQTYTGTGENGRKMALLSDFRGMEFELEIALKGVPENGIVEVWKLDAVRDELSFIQEYSEGILKLPKDTGSAIFLLNFRD